MTPPSFSRSVGGYVGVCTPRLVNCIRMSSSSEETKTEKEEKNDEEEAPKVYFASEITKGRSTLSKDKDDIYVKKHKETRETERDRYGPVKYNRLIDGDTFDGGDGQVGVVGDGTNNMEKFDASEVVGPVKVKESLVKESKSRQRVAWGSGAAGYADELKKKGMSKVDKYGDDRLSARRQQLENWRNQQEVNAVQRAKINDMNRLAGGGVPSAGSKWKRGKQAYFDDMNKKDADDLGQDWNKYAVPHSVGKKDGSEWEETVVSGDEKIEDTIQVVSYGGRPGTAQIELRNSVMTFEPYHCTFIGETTGFSVEPAEGTLNRRNGDPIPITVLYKGKGPGDNRISTLVVETEEDKWVYKVSVAIPIVTSYFETSHPFSPVFFVAMCSHCRLMGFVL
ncbi:unnamed protein product [Discosporangium mesarthrocarpum]